MIRAPLQTTSRTLARVCSRLAIVSAAAASLCLHGCVTESGGRPQRSGGGSAAARDSALLPGGPVASPAKGVSSNSRVLLGLASIGVIAFDGQVLPVVSPDGHFCAVQEGDPPTWPTLMAAPDAEVPTQTRLAVYDLTTSPPAKLEQAAMLEPGLMLGRAADSHGFLVESPRPDGARWIGRVGWQSGKVEWITRESAVSAHAMLTADGCLLYTRRPITGQVAELVIRTPSGGIATRSEPNLPYAMPMATSDPSTVYALLMTSSGIELHAISVRTEGEGAPRFGPVLARRLISSARDAGTAYQISVPMQSPLPRVRDGENTPREADPLAIFSPLLGRMTVFDVRTGALLSLAPTSFAATRWNAASHPGYLCTTPKGLVVTPDPQPGRGADSGPPDTRVLAEAYVPRRTADPKRPALLFGPVKSDPRLLEVIAIAPVDADQLAPQR